MALLKGKRALITGLLSNRSIAYGIAAAMAREGAELAFSYQSERFAERTQKLIQDFSSNILVPCDVASDEGIAAAFAALKKSWDHFDILVHSIAYAPAESLDKDFLKGCTRESFRIAHDISSYSLMGLTSAAQPFMEGRQGSVLTLTYLGAQRAMPGYSTMGLAKASLEAAVRYLAADLGPKGHRVNAISAGPIRTLAASGIKGFGKMLEANRNMAPLRRGVTIEEVGNAATFLSSDMASGITGSVLYVDAGANFVMGTEADLA